MNDNKIEAIIFDCDGVLVDSEIIASRVALEMLRPHGFDMRLEEYSRTFAGKVEADTVNIIRDEYKIDLPPDFLSKLKIKIEYALDNELEPIEGAYDTITSISLPKAVVSNSRLVRVIHSLKVASLDHLFGKKLFSAEMVERPKPDPAVYLLASSNLNVSPKNCLVIEDSISGATAAISAGMQVIGFLGASHIYNGHETRLKECGVFKTAQNMNDLRHILGNLLK